MKYLQVSQQLAPQQFVPYFTLEPLHSPCSKLNGQIKRDIMLMVADNSQELKLELIQGLVRIQKDKCQIRQDLIILVVKCFTLRF